MEIKNLCYKIKDRHILNKITVNIDKGINLIIGPNGSGKSTLLKLIYKIENPDCGEITGNDKRKISYHAQYSSVFHNVEVDYFLKLNRYLKTGSLNSDKFTKEIISIFSIKKFLHQSLSSLSGGERQRVMLASVFLLEKEIVLLDEPLSFLDISSKIEIVKTLEDNFSDKKLIIVTHNFELFKKVKKYLALKDGKVFFEGREINSDILEKLFEIEGSGYYSKAFGLNLN